MLWSPRKLAAHRIGHIRCVIMRCLQQSEYDIGSIIKVSFHGCIIPVCCKRILCQVVCAETQEVHVLSYFSR